MSDEKNRPYVNSMWREHKVGPASADRTINAYYRTKQGESYRAGSQDPMTFISVPPFVMTGLKALHPHLKGRMIRIQLHPNDRGILFHGDEPPTIEIPYPENFKDVTPAFLQLISRNERINVSGTIAQGQFGDLAPPIVRALKKLIAHCHITNQSWAEAHGGYRAERVRHSPPTRAIIDDWAGPQQQRVYNDGSVFHITPKDDALNRRSALDNLIRRNLLKNVPESEDGPPRKVLSFKEAEDFFEASKNENKTSSSTARCPIQPIKDDKNRPIEYVDTRLYSAHIANALVAGAINASTTALMNGMENPGIDYAFLSAGMGYYMQPDRRDFPNSRKPQLYAIYTPGFYEGIFQGVQRLLKDHKDNITPIKKLSFPYSDAFWRRPIENSINDLENRIRQEDAKTPKNQSLIDTLKFQKAEREADLEACQTSLNNAKQRITKLCEQHGVEVSFAREDALATRDSKGVRLYRATNNAGDVHAMPGNELGYHSVDAAIAQNLLDLANALCPNFNKKMQAFVLDYDNPEQIQAFQQAMKTFGEAIREARFRFYETLSQTAYFQNWQTNKNRLSYATWASLVFTALAGGTWGLHHAKPNLIPGGEGLPANITYGMAAVLVILLLAFAYTHHKKPTVGYSRAEFEREWHTFSSKSFYMEEMKNNPAYIQAENAAVATLSQAVDKIFPQTLELDKETKNVKKQENILQSLQKQQNDPIPDFKLARQEVNGAVVHWHQKNVAEKQNAYRDALMKSDPNSINSARDALKLASRRYDLEMHRLSHEIGVNDVSLKDLGYADSSAKSLEKDKEAFEQYLEKNFQTLLKECEPKPQDSKIVTSTSNSTTINLSGNRNILNPKPRGSKDDEHSPDSEENNGIPRNLSYVLGDDSDDES